MAKRRQRRLLAAARRREKPRTQYEQPDFLKQRKEWYEILKKEGFKDIENIDFRTGQAGGEGGSAGMLQGISEADILGTWTPDKQRYYELARQHYWTMYNRVWSGRLRKKRHRNLKIWQLHSEGVSYRKILKLVGCSFLTVSRVVVSEREKMLEGVKRDRQNS